MIFKVWLLCSLITFLLMSIYLRKEDCNPMQDWDIGEWFEVSIGSFLFPVGLIILFVVWLWPELIKERGDNGHT